MTLKNPNPNPSPANSSSPSSSSATKGNGNAQACAACKYQRRKCAADCLLAPYFPHDGQRQFLNAHRLFGVSNITKIIKGIPDRRMRDDAMRTIIFQSDVRAADPVGGCHRIIADLHRQIENEKAVYEFIQHHLTIYRAAAVATAAAQQQQGIGPIQEAFHFLDGGEAVHQAQQYQDDISSWVVQDSSQELIKQEGLDADLEFKPFHRRAEEVEFSIQEAEEENNRRDAATLFTLTNCNS